jgi:glutamine amidotransferase
MPSPVIIASGGANLASLCFALERLGYDAPVTENAAMIRSASHVILPGVGAARDAMTRLDRAGLTNVVRELQQPVLGICLGMQLLFSGSDEDNAECLGVIAGTAHRFRDGPDTPVPHMGWNQLESIVHSPLLAGIDEGAWAYFVHSYALPIGPYTCAATTYEHTFSSAVQHENFYGTQFHPERSASVGRHILANFLAI